MANSIIDDMLKDQIPNDGGNKKKKSKILIPIIIILIILIILAIVAIIYLKKANEISPKLAFFEYLGKNNISEVLEFDGLNELKNRMTSESSETSSKISFSVNGIDVNKLDNLDISLDSKNNIETKQNYTEAILNYSNNELFKLKFLASEKGIGIKSDEIVNKYIGSSYENLGTVISKAYKTITGKDFEYSNVISTVDMNNVNVQNIEMPELPDDILQKYIDVVSKNVDDVDFSTKTVTISRDSGNVDATEYAMSISGSKIIDIVSQILQTAENDEDLLNAFSAELNMLGITTEQIKTNIDEVINNLYNQNVDDSKIYTIKVYVYNKQTIKLTIDIAGEATIDFEYEYGDKENSVVITFLVPTSNNGISLTLKKSNSDVSEKLEVSFDLIQASEIVGKLSFTSNLLNSNTSYELTNKISLNYMLLNCDFQINTNVEFAEPDIENLDENNCLFMDTLDDQTFNDVVTAVNNKATEVVNSKVNQLSLIDTNTPNTLIEQPEVDENDTEAKENAKTRVIEAVSQAMTETQNNGGEYTLEDLNDLQIESESFSVVVSEDIALITLDGYEFKIDSDFNISE